MLFPSIVFDEDKNIACVVGVCCVEDQLAFIRAHKGMHIKIYEWYGHTLITLIIVVSPFFVRRERGRLCV